MFNQTNSNSTQFQSNPEPEPISNPINPNNSIDMIFDIEFPARKGRQQMRRNKKEKDVKRELRKSFHTKTKRVDKPKYVFELLDDSDVGGRVYTVFSWKLEKFGEYQITPVYTYPLNRGKVTDDKLAVWETGCLSSDDEEEEEEQNKDRITILTLFNPSDEE